MTFLKIGRRKLAKMPLCFFVVSTGRIFFVVERAEIKSLTINTYLGSPPFTLGHPHALESRGFANTSLHALIAYVLFVGAETQVLSCVVKRVAVDVIYLKAIWCIENKSMEEHILKFTIWP